MQLKSHLEHFTACIREGRQPLGVFLGAGCPKSISESADGADPLIPDTKGMTLSVRDRVIGQGYQDTWEVVLDQVKPGGMDLEEVNIEEILSQVRGLSQYSREDSEGSLQKENLAALEHEICEEIVDLVDVNLPDGPSGYLDLATWLGSIDRQEPVEIFTTNYDLLLEEALEKRRIPYFDGFVGGYRPFFDRHTVTNDELPTQWVRLWKLHGSMNWVSQEQDGSRRIWRTDDISGERAVIHPSHMKYDQSRKMPYLTLIDRLKQFLDRDESVLFIVGYSFGDEHINDVLIQALRESPTATVFAFMYGELDQYHEAQQIAKAQSNFCLFARDKGIIGTNEAIWSTKEDTSEKEDGMIGVEWEETGDGKRNEQFVLGNFEKFGELFRSVTGSDIL